VLESESTYTVDWVPRPSARLDPATPSTFESYNRSHILPPICQGQDDHVDLQLTGMSSGMTRIALTDVSKVDLPSRLRTILRATTKQVARQSSTNRRSTASSLTRVSSCTRQLLGASIMKSSKSAIAHTLSQSTNTQSFLAQTALFSSRR
jgi:hypothetical protein